MNFYQDLKHSWGETPRVPQAQGPDSGPPGPPGPARGGKICQGAAKVVRIPLGAPVKVYSRALGTFESTRPLIWIWENPASSLQWMMPSRRRLVDGGARAPRCIRAVFDWCRFGRPWHKATTLVGTLEGLDAVGRRCLGGHDHVQLKGTHRSATAGRWVNRTAEVAE